MAGSDSETEGGGLVPPYDDRSKGRGESESSEALTASVKEQLAETKTGADGATASPTDESPVAISEVTDEEPEPAKGVGESTTRPGQAVVDDEGKEPGRHDAGTQGPTERPVGTSDARDATGIDPQD